MEETVSLIQVLVFILFEKTGNVKTFIQTLHYQIIDFIKYKLPVPKYKIW